MTGQFRFSKSNLVVMGGMAAAFGLSKSPGTRKWLSEFGEALLLAWFEQNQAKALPPPPLLEPVPSWPTLVLSEVLEISPVPQLSDSPAPLVDAYIPETDQALANLVRHPSLVIIIGHRGSGKTALAERIQELKRHVAPPYAIGMPSKAVTLLPDWYGLATDFDSIPKGAVIYVPESYRYFHARTTQSTAGRSIPSLINLLRHRGHTLILDVQNAAHLDRNIISEADLLLIKEPGPFQDGFERSQLQGYMDSARAAFAGVGSNRKKKVVWVVAPQSGIIGQLMENQPPSFWSDSLSRVLGDAPVGLEFGTGKDDATIRSGTKANDSLPTRKGQKTPTEERRQRAKKMRTSGHTFGEIAKTLGICRSYACKLVKQSTDSPPAESPTPKTNNLPDVGSLIKGFLSKPGS